MLQPGAPWTLLLLSAGTAAPTEHTAACIALTLPSCRPPIPPTRYLFRLADAMRRFSVQDEELFELEVQGRARRLLRFRGFKWFLCCWCGRAGTQVVLTWRWSSGHAGPCPETHLIGCHALVQAKVWERLERLHGSSPADPALAAALVQQRQRQQLGGYRGSNGDGGCSSVTELQSEATAVSVSSGSAS